MTLKQAQARIKELEGANGRYHEKLRLLQSNYNKVKNSLQCILDNIAEDQ